jgi:serine/threonine protein kinase
MRWQLAGVPLGSASYIGPYRMVAQIHAGQYSVIYRCYDTNLGRQVAVKAVRPDSIGPMPARSQLWQEGRVRALLEHPHVLPLYRLVRARTGPLLVGPWLTGGRLHDRIRYPMPPAMILAVVKQIADALDAVSATGWWHGDVSPTNVLFTAPDQAEDDAPVRVVLSDFGTARRHGERPRGRGGLVVTPHVTVPEVWDDQPVDASSDLYGLGVLLYLALTGEYPFDSDDLDTFAYLHRHAAVPLPSDRSSVAGPATDEVALRALAKAPSERFATGAALAAALHTALRDDGQLDRRARDSNNEPGLHSRGNWQSPSSMRPIETAAILGAAEHLDHFAATLDLQQRAALRLLVARAGISEAHTAHETDLLTMKVFAPAAALRALEETGAAVVLADGPCTAAETARACGAPESTIPRLLSLLAAAGIIRRVEDRYSLPPGLAAAYRVDRLFGFPPVNGQVEVALAQLS